MKEMEVRMMPMEIRFMADGMLQSLGAWLRLMGYDCECRRGSSSRELLEQSARESRVFLTRNMHLRNSLPRILLERVEILYVLAERLPGQLREVVTRFELDTESFAFTRCMQCNVSLDRIDKPPTGIPANVAATEQEFWRCPACRQTFWRGSHVRNSLARLRVWMQD